jgi:predicted nucleic acid-binding Zn ribbon protein
MPIYEYICEQDGAVIELLRPMREADAPVPDPQGKGRVFRRKHSTFATGSGGSGARGAVSLTAGGCCPCGKPRGSCGSN